jgi:hypothetical protein
MAARAASGAQLLALRAGRKHGDRGARPAAFRRNAADLPALPQPTIVDNAGPVAALGDGKLPPGWTGGFRLG